MGGEPVHWPDAMRPVVAVSDAWLISGRRAAMSAVVHTTPVPLVRLPTVSASDGRARGEGTQCVGSQGASTCRESLRQLCVGRLRLVFM